MRLSRVRSLVGEALSSPRVAARVTLVGVGLTIQSYFPDDRSYVQRSIDPTWTDMLATVVLIVALAPWRSGED